MVALQRLLEPYGICEVCLTIFNLQLYFTILAKMLMSQEPPILALLSVLIVLS